MRRIKGTICFYKSDCLPTATAVFGCNTEKLFAGALVRRAAFSNEQSSISNKRGRGRTCLDFESKMGVILWRKAFKVATPVV